MDVEGIPRLTILVAQSPEGKSIRALVRRETERPLKEYVETAHRLGLAADYRMSIGTEAVEEAVKLCLQIAKEFPRAVFFAGKLVFEEERWFQIGDSKAA